MNKTKRIIPIVALVPLSATQSAQNSPSERLNFRIPPPLSLYVHVPWCERKCPYCDFNSHALPASTQRIPEQDYVNALIADLESALPLIWGRKINSIFFGGGTPSLLSGRAIADFLMAARARLPLLPNAEITLEANPGSVDSAKFAAFREAGVNRLSLGIQSFNDAHLQALGRIHNSQQARAAIEIAAQHFDNFNLDLMYGLPQQNLAEALSDVHTALSFAPTHLSCYQLTLEAHTAFAHAPPDLPAPDQCADMQEAIEAELASAGFIHYETSAFAKPGRQCQHNINYWTFGDYLGIGAGAASKLSLHDRVLRQSRWKQPAQYLGAHNLTHNLAHSAHQQASHAPEQNPWLQEEFTVAPSELPFEFMMNALRLNQGFDPALFNARTAQSLQIIAPILQQAEQDGLLLQSTERIAPSLRGQRFLNRLLERFL